MEPICTICGHTQDLVMGEDGYWREVCPNTENHPQVVPNAQV